MCKQFVTVAVVCVSINWLSIQVSVEQRSKTMNVKQEVKSSVLFMVDLAGSERAAVTQVH